MTARISPLNSSHSPCPTPTLATGCESVPKHNFSLGRLTKLVAKAAAAVTGWLSPLAVVGVAIATSAMAQTPDPIAQLQESAATSNVCDWAHWGPDSSKYSSWTTHSNRLIPIYTFGGNLNSVKGENSVYRNAERLKELYGTLPENTLNPEAEYFDQTDVYRLQKEAIASGKSRVILFVFDGMDWQTTRAAAIAKTGQVAYEHGRGTGLGFLDFNACETDFGSFVTSPHNNGTNVDVDAQVIRNPGGQTPGGYDPKLGGTTPWSTQTDTQYLISKSETLAHAYTDSASSAASMTTGKKTYNNAINVDHNGREILPIARQIQEDGFAVGAVTSVPISHATPACSYGNNVHRNDYQDITRDLIGVPSVFHPGGLPGLDVMIGAGWGEQRDKDGGQGKNFVPGNRYLTDDDLAKIDVKNGGKYVVAQRVHGRSGAETLREAAKKAAAKKSRLFGFFGVAGGHLPFQTADGNYDPVRSVGNPDAAKAESYTEKDIEENPTLADMAMAAIEVLDAKSDKWWLMVEAGDVDWANHANNIDNSIGAVLSGDTAFQTVTQWIADNGGWEDTFVIVTADHGHYLVLDKPERLTAKASDVSHSE